MSATVKDHTCKGLKDFQGAAEDSTCIPVIRKDGRVTGCDDSNPVLITHCPFCGVQL